MPANGGSVCCSKILRTRGDRQLCLRFSCLWNDTMQRFRSSAPDTHLFASASYLNAGRIHSNLLD